MDVNVVQCNDLLIIPESFSYNCCVLNFDFVDLQTLVTELKSTCIFFQPEKYKWNMQHNYFLIYFSMFSCIFPKLKIFRRCSKILKGLQKQKIFFEDICKIFVY